MTANPAEAATAAPGCATPIWDSCVALGSPRSPEPVAPFSPWEGSAGLGSVSPFEDDFEEEEPPASCVNCTGPLWGDEAVCPDCGHLAGDSASLFDAALLRGQLSRSAPASARRPVRDHVTAVAYDEAMLLHDETCGTACPSAGAGPHPERPDRVRAIWARLEAAQLAGRCRRLPCREATDAELEAAHSRAHVAALGALCDQLARRGACAAGEDDAAPSTPSPSPPVPALRLPADTYACADTARAARLSAGAAVEVALAVARGEADAGVCVARPPGHHAESNVAQGFCFLNNAAVAARAAQRAGLAERVLILDWDVHHGNGTQEIFYDDASVLYASLHRHEGGAFYPGTGAPGEVGAGAGRGFSLNVGWPCGGMTDADYLAAFQTVVLPVALEFAPDLVILSAGFDAAAGDPIGGCLLTPGLFGHLAATMQAAVAPCVAVLEGGYNLSAVAACTEACVRALLGERVGLGVVAAEEERGACDVPVAVPGVCGLSPTPTLPPVYGRAAATRPTPGTASSAAWAAIRRTAQAHAPYWRCMAALAGALRGPDAEPRTPFSLFGGLRPVASCPPAGAARDELFDEDEASLSRRHRSVEGGWAGWACGAEEAAPADEPVVPSPPGVAPQTAVRPLTPAISPVRAGAASSAGSGDDSAAGAETVLRATRPRPASDDAEGPAPKRPARREADVGFPDDAARGAAQASEE